MPDEAPATAAQRARVDWPDPCCDGYDWRTEKPRRCRLALGHRGLCSGDGVPREGDRRDGLVSELHAEEQQRHDDGDED